MLELAPALNLRMVTDGSDRIAWLKARSRGITASDAARLATENSIYSVAKSKLEGGYSIGNAYTDHGNQREPILASWANIHYSFSPSSALFHAEGEMRHLATPDGIGVGDHGETLLTEIKTTNKPWRLIPKNYLRQVWWQQYVLGAERTLLIWEEHKDFIPVHPEPKCLWIDRDENEIAALVGRADKVLRLLNGGRHVNP
ncbi:MAG: YqaJ viral recombinase family protein [Microbacteriaceae bacterium]